MSGAKFISLASPITLLLNMHGDDCVILKLIWLNNHIWKAPVFCTVQLESFYHVAFVHLETVSFPGGAGYLCIYI